MKIFRYLFIALILLNVTACTKLEKVTENNSNEVEKTENLADSNNAKGQFPVLENAQKLSLEELSEGLFIQVFGQDNGDGTIVAQRILVAEKEALFSEINNRVDRPVPANEPEDSADPNIQRPANGTDRFPAMENMTEEEKATLRANMQSRGGFGGGKMGSTGKQATRVNGRLLKVNNNILIIKVETGSQLVFVDENTNIEKIIE